MALKYWSGGLPHAVLSTDGTQKYWLFGLPLQSLATIGGQSISGTAGIVSGEAFGTTGAVSGIQVVTGTAGIVSGEAFGTNGTLPARIAGTAGIVSAEAFGTGSLAIVILALEIDGVTGIVSSETFGANGSLGRGISGTVGGIPSGEAFGTIGLVLGGAASGTTIPRFRLFVGGHERSNQFRVDNVQISRQLGTTSTMSFELVDTTGTYRPSQGDLVVYLDNNTVRFAGTVRDIEETFFTGTSIMTQKCTAADWNRILDRRILAMTYAAATYGSLTTIIADIMNRILTAEGISLNMNGDPGVALGDQVFDYRTLTDVFNQLDQATGWDHIVDFSRVLHYFDPSLGTGNAPFSIVDNNKLFRELHVIRQDWKYRNVEYIRTSQQNIGLFVDTFTVDQAFPNFKLRAVPSPRPNYLNPVVGTADPAVDMTTTVQTGGGGVTLRGDWANAWTWAYFPVSDPSAPNTVWYNQLLSPLTVGSTVTFTYPIDSQLPVLARSENDTEIAMRQSIEGGTGIYEIVDDLLDLNDQAAVNQAATALLARYGTSGAPIQLTVVTDTAGLEPGQRITVNTTKPLVPSQSYLIQSTSATEMFGKFLRTTATLQSIANFGNWFAFLSKLIKRTQNIIPRTTEVATFLLAKTVTGLTNPGLATGTNITEATYTVQKSGIFSAASVFFNTPPTTTLLVIDILQGVLAADNVSWNWSSIFGSTKLQFLPTDKAPVYVRTFRSVPTTKVAKGDRLRVDVSQADAGAMDGTITVEWLT